MEETPQDTQREIVATKVYQWLSEWEKVDYDEEHHRRKPTPYFYLFTMPASELKALTGISRRTTETGELRSLDLGIQRRHEPYRSREIGEFVRYGYPWSELSTAKRESGQFNDLRKPGWLPTSIVVNILKEGDLRRGETVAQEDLIQVEDKNERIATVRLPDSFSGTDWSPKARHPIEVIDGQHRLWAFEELKLDDNFQLPVVAFHGLDISWQAYLFWTINIRPKRINASLAFDLYPLLRTEDWLEKFEGHSIYRETRAQELTEALWAHPKSVWYHRINMLGEKGLRFVSQAAWIRSLMATYVKSWEGRGVRIGGLFGAAVGSHEEVLPWNRAQQAAFLMYMGQCLKNQIDECTDPWAAILREHTQQDFLDEQDPAFWGVHSLLNTDQGIRGILYVTNDCCYVLTKELELEEWAMDDEVGATDDEAVNQALESLEKQKVAPFIKGVASKLAHYDWRSSSAPNLSDEERLRKAAFRGGGGYKELRFDLLRHLTTETGDVGKVAKTILSILG